MAMARWEVWKEQEMEVGESGGGIVAGMRMPSAVEGAQGAVAEDVVEETTYTHAIPELIAARKVMCDYSLSRSRSRLEMERRRRRGMVRWTRVKKRARLFNQVEEDDDDDDKEESKYWDDTLKNDSQLVKYLDDSCEKLYGSIRNQALEGSQYGDVRPLSAVCTSSVISMVNDGELSSAAAASMPKLIATGGWSGGIKIWNGGNDHHNTNYSSTDNENYGNAAPLDLLGARNIVHEDRIMGIAMRPYLTSITSSVGATTLVATASIDLSAKLCKITLNEDAPSGESMDVDDIDNAKKVKEETMRYNIEECAHLKGHAARLCSVAFHPTGKFVATTSFDHTWRLWDIETSDMSEGTELLLQDGHAREVYGVGFHPDGSLVATTDFGGVVQCWDLRTGKSACHFLVRPLVPFLHCPMLVMCPAFYFCSISHDAMVIRCLENQM